MVLIPSYWQRFYHLFSFSVSQSYFPFEWRTHLVKIVMNYRPISLLSVASKVLEKPIHNCIVVNSISNNQLGFLHGRSTLQQLLFFFKIMHNCRSYINFRKALWPITNSCSSSGTLVSLVISGYGWKLTWPTGCSMCLLVTLLHIPYLFSLRCHKAVFLVHLFLAFVKDLPDTALFSKIILFADDAKCTIFPTRWCLSTIWSFQALRVVYEMESILERR